MKCMPIDVVIMIRLGGGSQLHYIVNGLVEQLHRQVPVPTIKLCSHTHACLITSELILFRLAQKIFCRILFLLTCS